MLGVHLRTAAVPALLVLALLAAPASPIPPGQSPAASGGSGTAVGEQPLSSVPCVGGMAGPYPCQNVDLLAFVPHSTLGCTNGFGTAGNDMWAWIDPLNGDEYALVGCTDRSVFVDVTVPTAPVVLGHLPSHFGQDSAWRDMKVYENHAFIVADNQNNGIQVFDLTQLRSVTNPPVTFSETAFYGGVTNTHNIGINEDTGFAYAVGSSTCGGGGPHMVNIQTPTNPTFAGCIANDGYTHDIQCVVYHGPDVEHQGQEICFNSNEDTLTIVDVTTKSAPVQLSRTGYPESGYSHQGWLTEDQRFFLLDDELDVSTPGTRTHIWDVRDLDDPVYKGFYAGATGSLDHNLYIEGLYAYESNYTAGLRIIRFEEQAVIGGQTLVLDEVGYFDIHPSSDSPDFLGTWSNYPYYPSGIVVVNTIEESNGLFVLQPNGLPPGTNSHAVSDATVAEGDSGSTTVTVTVSMLAARDTNTQVNWATVDGTATAGQDYTADSGIVTFLPGETTLPVTIDVLGDGAFEEDESFTVQLSSPQAGIELADPTGAIIILDDEAPAASLSVSDAATVEGDSAGEFAKLNLEVSTPTPLGTSVCFDYAVSPGTATAGEDYEPIPPDNICIQAGNVNRTIAIDLIEDIYEEGDETLSLTISNVPPPHQIEDATGVGTIVEDDTALVTALDPTSGPAAGGTEVTMTGTGFESITEIHFGATEASGVIVDSPTQVRATTPPLPAGTLQTVSAHNHPPGESSGLAPSAPLHPTGQFFLVDFNDVPPGHIFHDFVETLVRNEVTAGCGGGDFCVNDGVTRAQMAVFLLKSHLGEGYVPPACSGIFADVPCPSIFADWIEDLYNRGVTAGCDTAPPRYCPNSRVNREHMPVFLLKTLEGPGYAPPTCGGVFDDVACPSLFADWIEELAARGITAGCSTNPPNYCPAAVVNRGQMSVFLVKTFGLSFTP